MCQAALGKIIEMDDKEAIVQMRDGRRKVNTDLLDVKEGDYILCSLNLAVEKVDPEDAKQMIT